MSLHVIGVVGEVFVCGGWDCGAVESAVQGHRQSVDEVRAGVSGQMLTDLCLEWKMPHSVLRHRDSIHKLTKTTNQLSP